MYEDLLREAILTWLGISRLLLGNRMQFLHILLTRSSLMTTISWLQYWILGGISRTAAVNFSKNRQNCHTSGHRYLRVYQIYPTNAKQATMYWWALSYVLPARVSREYRERHPLSEVFCDVFCQGRPGTTRFLCPKHEHYDIKEQKSIKTYLGRMVPGPGSSGPGTKTKRLLLVSNEEIKLWTVTGANHCENFNGAYPLWMLGWAHIISARAFNDSKEKKISIIVLYFLC